ncbi:hypothetical protein Emed_001315 [Eimeria media]
MAVVYLRGEIEPAHIGHEAELFLSLANFLNTEKGNPVLGLPSIRGFGLPNVYLLALKIATDLRHHASIAGANLQRRAEMRKAAKGSVVFSSFFRLLSCRQDDDAEWLHKRFLPFASLAIRIALFLRVEVEEQSSKGWFAAVRVFGLGEFNAKAFQKVAKKMQTIAKKFIRKFMVGFGHKVTGKLEKIGNRIKKFFKRKGKTTATEVTTDVQRIGHTFAKLMLFMWTVGSKRQVDSQSNIDKNFYLARLYQALTILNHGTTTSVTLKNQALRFLKLALKNVMNPPEEIVNRLFLFIKQIHAIHDDEKVLFEAYLRWQRNQQDPLVISEWNGSIDVFKCAWHTSKSQQDSLLYTVIPKNADSTATGLAFSSETCNANNHGSLDLQQEQQDVFNTNTVAQDWN